VITRDKIIFFNTAWMEQYNGNWIVDVPINGGRWVNENKFGGEVFNFQPLQSILYGYVEPGLVEKNGRQRNINISRLSTRPGSKVGNSISNILVVWVATPKNVKRAFMMGWYENATVFRIAQPPPTGSNRIWPHQDNPIKYFTSANEQDCVLLPVERRTCVIPGKGRGFGRSNIWYAEDNLETKNRVIEFINNWRK